MTMSNKTGFDLDDGVDPFAPRSNTAGGNDSSATEGDFEEYPIPPTPIGVLSACVKSAKRIDKDGKLFNVIEFECTDPRFAGAEKITLFLDMNDLRQRTRYLLVASALGVVVPQVGGKTRVPLPGALVGKYGLVVYSTYVDKRDGQTKPTISWGYPANANKSDAFDAWAASEQLTEEQVKKIKQSPGVMPSGSF